ncbi:MAG: sugar ABC transporter substrate-binding protein [Lachnospiraceae bacterium]|nr:sugar ABC transporter substrate-binding protein [Lachnospiraceae bacterium]
MNNSDARGRSPLVITVFVSIAVMILATVISTLFYAYTTSNIDKERSITSSNEYSQYYALVCENNEFNRQVYEYAKEKGDELGICVDMLSIRTNHDYSVEDLFEIALESNVDGIIVEARDAQNMKNSIDKACQRGVDVVTLLSDCRDSMRRSSIQISAYNLGKIYGQQVVSKELYGDEKILVINDSSKSDASQNLIFTGIQDTVYNALDKENSVSISNYSVDGSDAFGMEEMIRDIFIDEELMPDIIICPDDQATEVVYQALVDYNKVGFVRLLGYHDSKTVLDGIKQGVIEATIAVDVKQLGEYSVEALSEYKATGFASEYYSIDSTLIDIMNISSVLASKESMD